LVKNGKSDMGLAKSNGISCVRRLAHQL
jgi:hypothetical protein